MKRAALFLLSFALVLVIAVFLAPFLHHFLPYKFERIFNRIVMISTLICAAVFVRIRRDSLVQYGLLWNDSSLKMLAAAFFCPLIVLSLYVAIQTFFGEA